MGLSNSDAHSLMFQNHCFTESLLKLCVKRQEGRVKGKVALVLTEVLSLGCTLESSGEL